MKNNEVYAECIKKWGHDAQLEMLMEECLECALAIRHAFRGKTTLDELVAEVADVEIMIEQARIFLPGPMIDAAKEKKLRRLEERLKQPA